MLVCAIFFSCEILRWQRGWHGVRGLVGLAEGGEFGDDEARGDVDGHHVWLCGIWDSVGEGIGEVWPCRRAGAWDIRPLVRRGAWVRALSCV